MKEKLVLKKIDFRVQNSLKDMTWVLRGATPRQTAPHRATPRHAAPRRVTPRHTAPHNSSPRLPIAKNTTNISQIYHKSITKCDLVPQKCDIAPQKCDIVPQKCDIVPQKGVVYYKT